MIKTWLIHKFVEHSINILFNNIGRNFTMFSQSIRVNQISRALDNKLVYYATDKNGIDIRSRCSSPNLYPYPLKIQYIRHPGGWDILPDFRDDVILAQSIKGTFGYGFTDCGMFIKDDDILYLTPFRP